MIGPSFRGRRRREGAVGSPIRDGKIVPPTELELIVTDHCNLGCRQCNHGAPVMRPWNADPEQLLADLRTLARVYRPRCVKLMGGEPLLHPRFTAVLAAARASRISERIRLVTNGTLLDRLSERAWALLDELEVSVYPDPGLDDGARSRLRARGRRFDTRVTISDYPEFRYTFSKHAMADGAWVARVFAACKIANVWGCHAVYRGRIYRCPQSIYAGRVVGEELAEGFSLEQTPDLQQLHRWLNGTTPLSSCRHCLGTCGRKISHRQVSRAEWRAEAELPPEQMIDHTLLERSLRGNTDVDDCRQLERPAGGVRGMIRGARARARARARGTRD